MNLAVTLRMKQYAVAQAIASPVDPPDNLVAAPSGRPRHLVAAHGAESTLAYPKTKAVAASVSD